MGNVSTSSSSSSVPTILIASNSNSTKAKHGKRGSESNRCYACDCRTKVGDTRLCAPSGSTGR